MEMVLCSQKDFIFFLQRLTRCVSSALHLKTILNMHVVFLDEQKTKSNKYFGFAFPAESKALASCHDSKFIETSSGIQHNVDELLVGIVKQVN